MSNDTPLCEDPFGDDRVDPEHGGLQAPMNPDGEATQASVPSVGVEQGRFAGPGQRAAVTVVVVTYNSASDVPQLIDDLRCAAGDVPTRLIIVDNRSSDDTVGIVRAH